MINKGTSCAGFQRLARHLLRTDTNERAEVKELRGVVAQDLRGALLEMEAVAAGTRTTKPFYHASINTREDEPLTDEQRVRAIDRLEAELGLYGQARAVVLHRKEGREHCHIVWSRIDLDRMTAISDSHNYRKHEQVARDLEREFGHERVQGAHVERDGQPRPPRTPGHAEMLQADRTGVSAKAVKEFMTGIWRETTDGKEFQAALEENGWMLARGDRRDIVAIDPKGGVHSVARRVEGAKAADVRQRFADLDPKTLHSVAEAKQLQRERQAAARPEPMQQVTPEREQLVWEDKLAGAAIAKAKMEEQRQAESAAVRAAAAKVFMTETWRRTKTGPAFQAALEKKGWILARGDRRDFVAIDPKGGVHSVARRVEGVRAADVRQRFARVNPFSLYSVAEAIGVQRERRESAWQARQTKRAIDQPRTPQASGPKRSRTRVAGPAVKVADGLFKALIGESSTPRPKTPGPAPHEQQADAQSQRRQELMRQLSREIPQETERDAEFERDRIERDRGRERSR
ncbi:relaxase/mobilization nuclease domain-containing protein [Bradyrhizobium sp. CCGUVB4N]|uniref:relaxase/mobilization nuclease domain-containing protein n=1 Tax=Bradyrhizobium sp. CCGUVB4N TaxID=2949631 RepID=UPI0020B364A6|nr:relaxase/mobilization nuclease domain-containing protein [Bradyrhizobium sp. CCGUVB4N]MCP3385956.1 relaxase/mobilization nuclease domain-containing protein [Bradyrhizobium sp. CCGUVB4N]